MKFLELEKKMQIGACTIPQAVSVTQNPDDETYDQVVGRQEKFLKLPENIKDKLISYQTAEKIQRIGKHYGLELLQMASIARMIRSYYFGEAKEESFPEILIKETGIDRKSAEEISKYVVERIIKTEIENKEQEARIVKLTLTQAMEKYLSVQDQLISGSLIKISGRDDMVKGSVRNWIKDYYAVVGAGNRDIMKRSSYIYHSQNAKSLSASEKQKLGFIIKALEENSLVTVDTGKGEIVFNISESDTSAPVPRTANPQNSIRPEILKTAHREVDHINENKKSEIAFGNKIANSVSQESDQTPSNQLGGHTENITHNQAGKQTKITHVQGNRFNLKSDHFEVSGSDKNSSNGIFGQNHRREVYNMAGSGNEENIKFSAPQQFPVEKEKFEKEKSKKSSFLRRIRPV